MEPGTITPENNNTNMPGVETTPPANPNPEPVVEPAPVAEPLPEPLPSEPVPPAPAVPEPTVEVTEVIEQTTIATEPVVPTTPAEQPAPVAEPTPVAEPASAPVQEPAPTPESAPAPESTPTPSPAPASPNKKLSGSAIAGIVISSIIVVVCIILGILSATGVIDWSQAFAGISLGGREGGGGGLFSNDPTPTASLAESTCKNHGGTLTDIAYQMEDYSSYYDETPEFLGAYECEFEGSESDNSNAIEFELIFIDGDIIDYYNKVEGSLPKNAEVLENSDEMIKFIDYFSDNVVEYFVLYKNAEVVLYATNYDTAEQALVELGFPNRAKADNSSNTGTTKTTETDTYKQELDYNRNEIEELKTAFLQYMTNNNGNLPTITPDYDDSDVIFELDVNGYDSTPANQFYRDYLGEDFVDYHGDEYHLHFYSDYEGSYYERNPEDLKRFSSFEIILFYNSKCNGSSVIPSSSPRDVAFIVPDRTGSSVSLYCTNLN